MDLLLSPLATPTEMEEEQQLGVRSAAQSSQYHPQHYPGGALHPDTLWATAQARGAQPPGDDAERKSAHYGHCRRPDLPLLCPQGPEGVCRCDQLPPVSRNIRGTPGHVTRVSR